MDLLKDLIILNRKIEIEKLIDKYNEDNEDDDDDIMIELLNKIKEYYKDLCTKKNHIQFKLIKIN